MSSRTRIGLWIGAVTVAVLAVVYVDVWARARTAFLEGEKYMDWHQHPEKKKVFYDDQFERGKAALSRELEQNEISQEDYTEKLNGLQFDRDYAMSESSLKYAYQWYKDTYELFSPPESKWVRLARQKAPVALDLWKEELRAQNVTFDDHTFD